MALPPCLTRGKHEELLHTPQSELFEIIECAITVAALRWSEELLAEKDRLLKGFDMCKDPEAEGTPIKETRPIEAGGLMQKMEQAVENQRRTIHLKVDLPNRDRKSMSKVTTEMKTTKPVNLGDRQQEEGEALENPRRIKVDLLSNTAKPALQKAATSTTAAAKRISQTKRDNEARGDYEKKLEITKRKLQSGYTACEESRKWSKVIDFWTELPKNTQQQIIGDKKFSTGRVDNKKARSFPASSQQQVCRRRQLVPLEIQHCRPPPRC
ncbi:unnamed protein product [Linum trigynum]|uniref:Uncharacterized protein n=1 Tax=Linum trigynum TaxID=586398 RepID=A0AAV2DTQ0_9ROSI